jgi:hypothetical protein
MQDNTANLNLAPFIVIIVSILYIIIRMSINLWKGRDITDNWFRRRK